MGKPRFESPRLDLFPGLEPVQIVGPSLHHVSTLGQERRPVVGPAVGIPDRVGQLVLDEVGPEAQHLVQDGARHRPEPVRRHPVPPDVQRPVARSLAALARRSAAGLLLLLATLLTVPAQAQQAAVPGAPTDLTATAVGETTINLAWTAPADNGGDAIIGYQIEVWVAGGMHWAVLEDDTESAGTDYAHTELMDGRTRYYRVSAINSVGAGATSNVASATTTDMMAPQFSGNAGDTSVPVNGTDVLLQFDESLDRGAGRVPLASAFTVTADGVAIAVDGVHVEGTVVRLALDGVDNQGINPSL